MAKAEVYEGKPCVACGSRLRFVKARNCVACARHWYMKNKEVVKARRARHAVNKEESNANSRAYSKKNRRKVAADPLARYYANPEKEKACRRAQTAWRRAAYKRPYVKPHRKAIKTIYEEAERLQQETGIKHHVDHVVPLKGKNVLACMCPGT
jgi:hypothetical protein